jgi:1-deoxy-D-xylulose-5-phosphate reductoisomerase
MNKKNIVVFGSTGSIGKMTLEVIENYPEQFSALALSTNSNIELLFEQIQKFKPKYVSISNIKKFNEFTTSYADMIKKYQLEVFCGDDGLLKILDCAEKIDLVLVAVVGAIGLQSIYKAIKKGFKVAVANKEPIVIAGEFLTAEAKKQNNFIFPVDSEHSAIFQCLIGENSDEVKRVILTASGGPFYKYSIDELKNVSVKQALAHPRWKMGKKITIDSATLMNKGFEIIEAHYLFNMPQEKIEVIIHPESIVHSMVEFVDGSIKAHLGQPDMKIPIQYALTYPNRQSKTLNSQSSSNFLNFGQLKQLNFSEVDFTNIKFQCLKLAIECLKKGNDYLVILNAANEILVEKFLNEKIEFLDIPKKLNEYLEKHSKIKINSIDEILELDKKTRIDLK